MLGSLRDVEAAVRAPEDRRQVPHERRLSARAGGGESRYWRLHGEKFVAFQFEIWVPHRTVLGPVCMAYKQLKTSRRTHSTEYRAVWHPDPTL